MDHEPPPIACRQGPLLVVSTGASLPPRCVKCNEPEACRQRVKLQWHTPSLYFLLLTVCVISLLGFLVYAIVAAVVSRRVKFDVGLCRRHRRRRRTHMLVGASVSLAGLALALSAILWWQDISTVLIGIGLGFAGLIYLNFAVPILRVTKIERSAAYVKGCSAEFLATLGPLLQCAACGYDLRGHDAGAGGLRCPECGALA